MPLFDEIRQSVDLFNPFGGATDTRGGRVIGDNGRALHVRDSHSAARRFSLNQHNWHHVPKPKFLFWVRFFSPHFRSTQLAEDDRNSYIQGLSFLVKSVDKPGITLQADTLQQYNKKRVIYTGVQYDPVTVRFHDDVNNDVLSFWRDYFKWYYGDTRDDKTILSHAYDQTMPETNNPDWGFSPLDLNRPNAESHFLSHMHIYQFFGGKMTQIEVANPKITRFDHENADYSDASGASEIGMTFEHEGVIYSRVNESLDGMQDDEIASLLLDLGDYYQLPEVLGNKDLFNWAPRRAIQDATDALIQGKIPRAKSILTGVVGEVIPLRRDQIQDILEGAQGNIGQRVLTGVLTGRGFSFGTSRPAELEGYQANINTPGRLTDAAQQLARRGNEPDGLLGGLQHRIESIGSGVVNTARGLIDTTSELAETAYGDLVAAVSAADRSHPGTYVERGATGSRLTNQGVQRMNALSPPTVGFANNVRSQGIEIDPTGRANRDA